MRNSLNPTIWVLALVFVLAVIASKIFDVRNVTYYYLF